MKIELTNYEMDQAADVGRSRNAINRDAGQADGCVMESLDIDIQGAQAELAVAKAFKMEWTGRLYTYQDWQDWRKNGHDVGPIEVRSTRHENGRLILHPSDNNKSPFVLIRSHKSPEFDIVGWQWGVVGKSDHYWHDVGYGRPCFYVPNAKLRPIQELIDNLINRRQ